MWSQCHFNVEMKAFEQTLSIQKDGDVEFCKNNNFTGENYFIKRNDTLTKFNVIQRTLIIRRGGDGKF